MVQTYSILCVSLKIVRYRYSIWALNRGSAAHGVLILLSRIDEDEVTRYMAMYTNNEIDELFDLLKTRSSTIWSTIKNACASTRLISKVKSASI